MKLKIVNCSFIFYLRFYFAGSCYYKFKAKQFFNLCIKTLPKNMCPDGFSFNIFFQHDFSTILISLFFKSRPDASNKCGIKMLSRSLFIFPVAIFFYLFLNSSLLAFTPHPLNSGVARKVYYLPLPVQIHEFNAGESIAAHALLGHPETKSKSHPRLNEDFFKKSKVRIGGKNTTMLNKTKNIFTNLKKIAISNRALTSMPSSSTQFLKGCEHQLERFETDYYIPQIERARRIGIYSTQMVEDLELVTCFQKDMKSFSVSAELTKLSNDKYWVSYISGTATANQAHANISNAEPSNLTIFSKSNWSKQNKNQRLFEWLPSVAHAGGGLNGQTYTNSIEALNFNSTRFELFEIDFSWTSDGHLVCLHDWGISFERSFGIAPEGKKSLSDFLELVNTRSDLNVCTLNSLTAWLKEYAHARIITDIKEDNIRALILIRSMYPELQHRFIPQVYQPLEYYEAAELGFRDIIWTLYRFNGDDSEVLSHISQMDLYALTMPRDRADRALAQKAKSTTGVLSYVHTINSQEEFEKYRHLGIAQIYTDFLPQPKPNTPQVTR